MPKSTSTEYLKPFIEATIASAARFRRVLIVLIVTSILAFGAFWNAAEWSWINSRIHVARAAETHLSIEEAKEQLNAANKMLQEDQERLDKGGLSVAANDKLTEEIVQLRRDVERQTREKEKLEKS